MNQTNFLKIYIIPMTLLSPLLTMSCNSWFSIWMMMELNLMSFTPMIIYLNKYFKELSFKYFIIQAISSSMLILAANSILINLNKNFFWINLFMNFSLIMKLGMPPFHLWFINLMNNMTWLNCLILSTWQKIIPMIILMYTYMKTITLILTLYASIMSSMMGLNHQSLRSIFSYSSINHMSWMLLNLMISEMMWMLYFTMYSLINMSLMLIMHNYNIYYTNQMFTLNQFNKFKMFMFLNILSISGLPPMFGFNMKWLSIFFFTLNNLFLINSIMILMSMFTFIFYTRLMISFMTMSSMKNKLSLLNKMNLNKKSLFYLSFLNLWIMSMWMN